MCSLYIFYIEQIAIGLPTQIPEKAFAITGFEYYRDIINRTKVTIYNTNQIICNNLIVLGIVF